MTIDNSPLKNENKNVVPTVNLIKQQEFTHKVKGGRYIITDFCEMQINQEWLEAVVYKSLETGKKYCREEKDWEEKFSVISVEKD